MRISEDEEEVEELSIPLKSLLSVLFFCFWLFMLTFIDPELYKLVAGQFRNTFSGIYPYNFSETLILFAKL